MKVMLVLAVLIQIAVAIQSDGLPRAIAELTAFLLVVALVIDHKKAVSSNKPLDDKTRLASSSSVPTTSQRT